MHTIRSVEPRDAEQIAAIYNYYVADTIVTFEEEPVAPAEIAARIARVTAAHPWLVCEQDGAVAGYAYAAPWHSRCAYRLSTETTVYLARERVGRGLGTALYGALVDELRRRGFHCAIGGIALPNEASMKLHERLGFVKVAHFKEVGWKFGAWIDVGYWELIL